MDEFTKAAIRNIKSKIAFAGHGDDEQFNEKAVCCYADSFMGRACEVGAQCTESSGGGGTLAVI